MNLYFERDTNLTSENGTVMDPITVCPFVVVQLPVGTGRNIMCFPSSAPVKDFHLFETNKTCGRHFEHDVI